MTPTKEQTMNAVPCPKCGAWRTHPCKRKRGQMKNHAERMHLSQLLLNAYEKSGQKFWDHITGK